MQTEPTNTITNKQKDKACQMISFGLVGVLTYPSIQVGCEVIR